jgi:hypothetical protein
VRWDLVTRFEVLKKGGPACRQAGYSRAFKSYSGNEDLFKEHFPGMLCIVLGCPVMRTFRLFPSLQGQSNTCSIWQNAPSESTDFEPFGYRMAFVPSFSLGLCFALQTDLKRLFYLFGVK